MSQTVTGALANTSQAPAQVNPRSALKSALEQYRPIVSALLAKTGVDEPTFVAQIANAMRQTPDLWKCDVPTVVGAALKCAQLGLAPNDPRNLAWIIPYGKVATFQMGYGGYLELARRAVPGIRFAGRAVYPNDEFDLDFGAEQPLRHVPAAVKRLPRGGDAYAWYIHVRWPTGEQDVYHLDKEGVEYHRNFSKQKNGTMWKDAYDAAALKSVVLDAKRWLPTSTALTVAFAADEETFDVREMPDDDAPIEATITPPLDGAA